MKFAQFNIVSKRPHLAPKEVVVAVAQSSDHSYRQMQHMSTLLMSEVNPKGC